jgi:hypothetical protein
MNDPILEHGERRRHERRLHDRRLLQILVGLVSVTTAITIAGVMTVLVVTHTVFNNRDNVVTSVCAVVSYAEEQADNLRHPGPDRPPNYKAARSLDKLAVKMRATGITCPPRLHKTVFGG